MIKLKNNLKNYLYKEICNELEEYKGISQYGCDLGYTLFESANFNGTYTYSTYEAKKWIQEYWEDIGEVVEELNFQFGEYDNIPNVFEQPEAFMVCIMLELATYMLAQCPYINKNWNNEIQLTPYKINKIKKELAETNNTWEVYT